MELIDILARKLDKWPKGWPAIGQASDGSLHREPFLGGHTTYKLTLATDYISAEITFDQWVAARESLVNTETWGDGVLPPVGTFCEFAGGEDCPHDPWDKDLQVGDPITIIAHFDGGNGDQLAAFTFPTKNPNRGAFNVEQGSWGCFRPIRTPEQIEAEERKGRVRAIEGIMIRGQEQAMTITQIASAIVSAGYRKQGPTTE